MSVRVVATEEERLQAYRIRYDVFCLECGDDRYADHERRVFIDANDKQSTTVLLAYDQLGRPVGTGRVTIRRECPFIRDHSYFFDRLATAATCPIPVLLDSVALFDRVAILPAARGKALLAELNGAMEHIAANASCNVSVSVSRPDNQTVQNCLKWLGWTQYHVHTDDLGTWVLLFKRLSSLRS